MTELKVGGFYPQYRNGMNAMLCDYNAGGLYFIALVNSPTRKEIRDLKGGVRFGCAEIGQIDWLTFFFGGLEFDCHFAPGFFKFAKPNLELFPDYLEGEWIMTQIMSFDSKTGECLGIRVISIDPGISKRIVELARSARPLMPEEYHYAINQVMDSFSTRDLRKMAEKQGMTQTFIR